MYHKTTVLMNALSSSMALSNTGFHVEIAMDDVGYTTNIMLHVYIMQNPDHLYSKRSSPLMSFAPSVMQLCHQYAGWTDHVQILRGAFWPQPFS